MKGWKLDRQQRVCVDTHRNVHFLHYYHRGTSAISLSWRQFLNLNDVVMDLDTFRNLKYYPLGKNLWLQYDKHHIQLYHCHHHIYFTFHRASWIKYRKETHRQILSFLRHGANALHDCQHAETHASVRQSKSQHITSPSTKQQNISRTPSNVSGEDEQRTKCANLPEWDRANTGRSFSFIGAVHALGVTTDPTSDMEEGEVCDIGHECGQSSDLYTIE